MNFNFDKLTFHAFCLLAQEMLPLVSCLVGFKRQLPIRTNFACNFSATAISFVYHCVSVVQQQFQLQSILLP